MTDQNLTATVDAPHQDDPAFGPAFIDVDEWRESPVPHRYLHGGFEGTETRFVMYLPERDAYQGRMVQELAGGVGGIEAHPPEYLEKLLRTAFRLGAFVVASNQGWILTPERPGVGGPGLPEDLTILSHRASAQTARYAKRAAAELLGARPHHAYLIGGSGGGARSVSGMEQVPGLWDGAVPIVMVNQHLSWHYWSLWIRAEIALRHKKDEITAAVDAGAGPFAVLDTDEQRQCLSDLYFAGYPKGAEYLLSTAASDWANWVPLLDPKYPEDYWKQPGYAGEGREPFRVTGTVTELIRASDPEAPALMEPLIEGLRELLAPEHVVGARLDGVELTDDLIGCRFTVGEPGREVLRVCTAVAGDCIGFVDFNERPAPPVGHEITLDNTLEQAWAHYHRHIIDPERPTMRRWTSDGRPIWPQRPADAERRAVLCALPTGRFEGRMIVVQGDLDHLCPPLFAHEYVESIRARSADGDDRIRLWVLDNAMHGEASPELGTEINLRFIRFLGATMQALDDLVRWVEDDVKPPADTAYELDSWNRTHLAPTAARRGGIQPIVTLEGPTVAKVGETVRFTALVEVPSGTGSVVVAAWDVDGTGRFQQQAHIKEPAPTRTIELEHRFTQAGTHVVVLRAASQREGDTSDPVRTVENLARLQVRVTD
ncbi:PKD domain-containing protein [Streptomyces sp. NPDC102384]|uniref:PKD domain-containing protein n=1 Tax=Streptomyces sp. NPDC102384 TaxID=3366166 RepID=UPI00381A1C56